MGTVIFALLAFFVVLFIVSGLPRDAASRHKDERCVYCGTQLKVVAGRSSPVCQECGREQPSAEDLVGHGRH